MKRIIKCPKCGTKFDVTSELERISKDLKILKKIVNKYKEEI